MPADPIPKDITREVRGDKDKIDRPEIEEPEADKEPRDHHDDRALNDAERVGDVITIDEKPRDDRR